MLCTPKTQSNVRDSTRKSKRGTKPSRKLARQHGQHIKYLICLRKRRPRRGWKKQSILSVQQRRVKSCSYAHKTRGVAFYQSLHPGSNQYTFFSIIINEAHIRQAGRQAGGREGGGRGLKERIIWPQCPLVFALTACACGRLAVQ